MSRVQGKGKCLIALLWLAMDDWVLLDPETLVWLSLLGTLSSLLNWPLQVLLQALPPFPL